MYRITYSNGKTREVADRPTAVPPGATVERIPETAAPAARKAIPPAPVISPEAKRPAEPKSAE